MKPPQTGGLAPELAEDLALHALTWLAGGCAVGLLLAGLLAWPEGNAWLAPLTYGRWAPVHLDVLLYGWTALPIVGLLLRLYLPGPGGLGAGRLALAVWSGALGAGTLALLAGGSGGKLFLDWSDAVKALWLAALALLWILLAVGFRRALAVRRAAAEPLGRPAAAVATEVGAVAALPVAARGLLLLLLAAGPWALALALDLRSYPPIDPTTGGPTGTDLAASTVAILPVFLALPALLGLERLPGAPRPLHLWLLFAVHAAALPLFGLGDQSHRSPLQVLAIASVLIWPIPLSRHLLGHRWPQGSQAWLVALGGWGALLATSALVTFFPAVLDEVKFTHALVGHAHLAMGGFTSSFAALTLHALARGSAAETTFAARRPFVLWQSGTALHVVALVALGLLEAGDPGLLQRQDGRVAALFALRGAAGVALLLAAATWLAGAARAVARAGPGPASVPPPERTVVPLAAASESGR